MRLTSAGTKQQRRLRPFEMRGGDFVRQSQEHPVVMSRTANVKLLLVLVSVLAGTSIDNWVGGFFGSPHRRRDKT